MPNPHHTRIDPLGNQIRRTLIRDAAGLWGFENGGNVGFDSSPKANHLTNNNAVSLVAGKFGQAASFVTANSQYLSIVDNATLNLDSLSYEFTGWVYILNVAAAGNQGVFDKDTGGAGGGCVLRHGQSSNFLWIVRQASGTDFKRVNATTFGNNPSATWLFVDCYADIATATVGISVNGGAFTVATGAAGVPGDTAAGLRLGATQGIANYLGGYLDGCALHRRLLTASERAWRAAGGRLV